jgi:trigger factor
MLLSLAACNNDDKDDNDGESSDTAATTDENWANSEHIHGDDCGDNCGHSDPILPGYVPDELNNTEGLDPHFLSFDIDPDGYWTGITALDYVTLFDYLAFELPPHVHSVSEDELDFEMYRVEQSFPANIDSNPNRKIKDGDKVNIDFAGSIDGVAFDGGTGTATVTAGTNEFIDDFLWQIIGMSPGQTADIEVSFPDPYHNEPSLAGKPAVFVTTINYIEDPDAEFDDAHVKASFYDRFGLSTVAELRNYLREDIITDQTHTFIIEYLANEVEVDVPDYFMDIIESRTVENYRREAARHSMKLSDYIAEHLFISGGLEGLLEFYRENNGRTARSRLVLQAIAEDADITVTADYLEEYLLGRGYDSVEQAVEEFGLPYLYQTAKYEIIFNLIIDNAILS